jgi:hypothetical protein
MPGKTHHQSFSAFFMDSGKCHYSVYAQGTCGCLVHRVFLAYSGSCQSSLSCGVWCDEQGLIEHPHSAPFLPPSSPIIIPLLHRCLSCASRWFSASLSHIELWGHVHRTLGPQKPLQMRKPRSKERGGLAQGHVSNEWQNQKESQVSWCLGFPSAFLHKVSSPNCPLFV